MRRQEINYTQAQRTFPGLPLPVSSTASVRANEDNESRVLHHHGGAVFLVARRQCAARRRDRAADAGGGAVVAHAVSQVLLRRVLCAARPVRRRLCRPAAQGASHVHRQHHQDLRLRADALGHRPAARLRGGRSGRRGLLAGKVRHPHRVPAAPQAGGRQWLDRRPHRGLDPPRHRLRRRADQRARLGGSAALRLPDDRYAGRYAGRSGDRGDRHRLYHRGAL